jgi:hypothetical protein
VRVCVRARARARVCVCVCKGAQTGSSMSKSFTTQWSPHPLLDLDLI